jgi:hypothetical protein
MLVWVEPLFLITVQAAKKVRCETRTFRRRQAHRFVAHACYVVRHVLDSSAANRLRKNFALQRVPTKSSREQSQLLERAEEIVEGGNKCCAY